MTILITGATGLIGTKLTQQCLDTGATVHYLTTSKHKIKNDKNYKGFYWDPYNDVIDIEAFDGVSVIVNLVGATIATRWTNAAKKEILESRTKTANLLFKTLKNNEHQVKHFVSASGISVYPPNKTKLYTEESTEVDDGFLAEVVLAWEAAADQFSSLGIDVAKVRTGVVFSMEDGAFPKLVKPVKLGVPAPLGSGEQWISWIHLNDIAGIYSHIINKELEGVYNAVAPTPINNNKLTRLLADKLGVKVWLPNVPGFMLKLILGEMSQLVLEGQLVSSKKIIEQGYNFEFYNAERAVDNLLKTENASSAS